MKYVEGAELSDIKVGDVDIDDSPKFTDAYVVSCYVDGCKANDDELDYINEEMPWVAQEIAYESLVGK